jgi:hypothetical protein
MRQTLILGWAIIATLLGLMSTMVAVFLFSHRPPGHATPAGWVRWEISTGGNGHYYKAMPGTNGLTWTAADLLARLQGGYLATVTSAAENDFVFRLVTAPEFFPGGKGPALGGYQLDRAPEPDGGWCWVGGEPWNYRRWHATEPNNGRLRDGTEDRLQFYSGAPGTPASTWNDINRDDTQVGGYVIERND